MKDYVMKTEGNSSPKDSDIVWAFDLGKGSIGEAVRRGNEFIHTTLLLIPAKFEKDKTGKIYLAGFVLETLLNRCIRLADRKPVCAI